MIKILFSLTFLFYSHFFYNPISIFCNDLKKYFGILFQNYLFSEYFYYTHHFINVYLFYFTFLLSRSISTESMLPNCLA